MTKPTNWKIPDVRRAIKVAHDQGLLVEAVDIRPDGTIALSVHDSRRVPPPSDQVEAA